MLYNTNVNIFLGERYVFGQTQDAPDHLMYAY